MTDIVPFRFEEHQVRVLMDERGEPWFVAADVCAALGISNPRDAVSRLRMREKGVGNVDTPGGPQQMTTVSEPGVYRLTFTSRVEGAERFKDWLAEEVLPSIRKTGSYSIAGAALRLPQDYEEALAALLDSVREQKKLQASVKEREVQLAAQAPKVEAHDRYLEAGDTMSLRDASKVLGMREQAFINQLLQDGILYRTAGEDGRLRAYAEHEKAGRFVHRAGTAQSSKHAYTQVRVTTKGVDWLGQRYARAVQPAAEGASP